MDEPSGRGQSTGGFHKTVGDSQDGRAQLALDTTVSSILWIKEETKRPVVYSFK